MSNPEIEPRKENKAFAVWVLIALIVLAVSIFVVINVFSTMHPPVAPDSNAEMTRSSE